MTLGANSYGSVAEVQALTARYLSSGSYTTGTRPTLVQVEKFIDNASATLNVLLAKAGFAIPIADTDAAAACGQIVVECAVDLCHAANSTGRFYTDRALERGESPLRVLRQDMADWVDDNAAGLELLGATRTYSGLSGIAYRDSDNGGDATNPIFQRDAFGNSFQNWDSTTGDDE